MEKELDVICVCDQFANGIVTEAVRERLCGCAATVIVDSRNNIAKFHDVIMKPNEQECAAALQSLGVTPSDDDEANARTLAELRGSRVMLTLGGRGSLWMGDEIHRIAAVKYDGPVDFCGAGDTFLSAFASFLAAGAAPEIAAKYASAASGTTIRKIGVTGTATREEILERIGESL